MQVEHEYGRCGAWTYLDCSGRPPRQDLRPLRNQQWNRTLRPIGGAGDDATALQRCASRVLDCRQLFRHRGAKAVERLRTSSPDCNWFMPQSMPVGSTRWRSTSRSCNARSSPRTTSKIWMMWPNVSWIFSATGKQLRSPSNGSSRAMISATLAKLEQPGTSLGALAITKYVGVFMGNGRLSKRRGYRMSSRRDPGMVVRRLGTVVQSEPKPLMMREALSS